MVNRYIHNHPRSKSAGRAAGFGLAQGSCDSRLGQNKVALSMSEINPSRGNRLRLAACLGYGHKQSPDALVERNR